MRRVGVGILGILVDRLCGPIGIIIGIILVSIVSLMARRIIRHVRRASWAVLVVSIQGELRRDNADDTSSISRSRGSETVDHISERFTVTRAKLYCM